MKRLLILFAVTASATTLQAQECFEGEFVLSVPPIDALQDKALASIRAVSDEPVLLTEENARAILVEELSAVLEADSIGALEPSEDLCARLKKRERAQRLAGERVRRVECSCNGVFRSQQVPNDSFYHLQWGLHQSNDIDVDAPEAWQLTRGSRSIVVGVIDSGVDYQHPDLASNMWRNSGEIAGNGVDDDGNGYIDDVHGLNAITYNASSRLAGNPMDDNGHGTHVAGTIGAASNNGSGVTGVTWNIQMVPIKFLNASGSGSLMDAIEAIDYATTLKRRGVNLVLTNNSWGGGGYFQPLADSIRAARDEGILFVAAAGNNTSDVDAVPSYPGSYALDNIISVAATTRDGGLASFSNYGRTSVDIGAPGDTIASTYLNSGYVYLSGTSMAAPHVSGGLALLKAYSSQLTWTEMKSLLMSTGDAYASLNQRTVSGRMMNIHRLLLAAPFNPIPPPGSGPTPTPTPVPTATPTPLPTPTPTPVPTVAPGNWNISGQVTFNGAALPGARIELRAGGSTLVRMSDANGAFSFAGIRGPVAYTLVTSSSGYVFQDISGTLTQHVSHSIPASSRAFTLTVEVVTPDRQPVSGVTVNAGSFGTGTTDSLGRVRFQVPGRMTYQVQITSNHHSFSENTLTGELLGDSTRIAVARLP